MRALLAIAVASFALSAAAESDAKKNARLELEAELNSMVKIPPPYAHIQFFGLDEGAYELTDVEFLLDGKPLPEPKLESLKEFAAITIHKGEVSHGDHVLNAMVKYTDGSSMMFSETAGYSWVVKTKVTFTAQRGLETRVLLTPSRDSSRPRDQQFQLKSTVTPIMIAQLDDGTIVEKKKAQVPVEPPKEETALPVADAGEPTALVAEVAPEVKSVSAEQKKVVAEETKLAVFKPAPEPVKKQEPLSAPPIVHADETLANEAPAVEAPPVADVQPAQTVAEAPVEEGLPVSVILGLVAAPLVIGVLVFVSRRRANRFKDVA